MQKDIFDDIFDTTDDDNNDDDDPAPLIPTPTDFQVERCTFVIQLCAQCCGVHCTVHSNVRCLQYNVHHEQLTYTCTQYGGVKSTVVYSVDITWFKQYNSVLFTVVFAVR